MNHDGSPKWLGQQSEVFPSAYGNETAEPLGGLGQKIGDQSPGSLNEQ